jgi:chromate transporter
MGVRKPAGDVPTLENVRLAEAFWFWLRLGFTSFGGPAGQIAMMHAELVQRRRWISEQRFLHALNYCMLLPGPEAQQLAIYIGWLLHRSVGGMVAGVLFVLPSLLILIALSWAYMAFADLAALQWVFQGIKPVVAVIVLQAAHRLASRTLRNRTLLAIAVASFVALGILQIPFPFIVMAAAAVGYLGGRFVPDRFAMPATVQQATRFGPALIDDHTPPPAHAQFRWRRLLFLLVVGGALWGLPLALLAFGFGWAHTLTQMAWFFSRAACITFGGAYAVLPYVQQAAVEHYGWLSAPQMIDGLALGETTPGPLIMVVAFVGFVGGYLKALFGPDTLFWAGAAAAMVATWFTFLPSFLFIFAGAPLVESTRGAVRFMAPLAAITAAVVGVILDLAIFLVRHAFWPDGIADGLHPASVAIAAVAALALFRFQWKVIPVVLLGAVLGFLVGYF